MPSESWAVYLQSFRYSGAAVQWAQRGRRAPAVDEDGGRIRRVEDGPVAHPPGGVQGVPLDRAGHIPPRQRHQ
eukprot:104344-Prorocentrum_minimum.AAC.1